MSITHHKERQSDITLLNAKNLIECTQALIEGRSLCLVSSASKFQLRHHIENELMSSSHNGRTVSSCKCVTTPQGSA